MIIRDDLPAEGQPGKERKEKRQREDGGQRDESTYILATPH